MVDLDGNPWFVAADVCEALGLSKAPSNGSYQTHYRRLAADQLSLVVVDQPKSQRLRLKVMSEAGVYTLVMRSDKPEAKAFQTWVTGTVLPAIRKDGAYVTGEEKLATGEKAKSDIGSSVPAEVINESGLPAEAVTRKRITGQRYVPGDVHV